MMKVQCPKCKATYKVNEEKLPDEGINVRCQKCEHPFFVEKEIKPIESILVDQEEKKEINTKTKLKKCPRCKAPQKGIDKCEYCGLVFTEYKKTNTNITDKSYWVNLFDKKSSQQNPVTILVSIVVIIACVYFYVQYERGRRAAKVTENNKKSELVKQKWQAEQDKKKRAEKRAEKRKQRKAAAKNKTPAEIRQDKIKKQFSAWDGSHRNLERLVKEAMNDPDSYDHVKTVYWDKADHLIVLTTFRGKNAFGGVVKNSVKAKVDLNGNVIQILEQGR